MKLTKLLCKYLDRDGKGYVTAGNLIAAAGKLGFLSTVAAGYVRGATIVARYWDGNVSTTALNEPSIIDVACIPIAIIGTTLALTVVLSSAVFISVVAISSAVSIILTAIAAAWGTKIVKCERKEGDDQHDNI